MNNIGICAVCGKEFVRGKHQSSKIYCSTECIRVVNSARQRKNRAMNREKINQQKREQKRKKRMEKASKIRSASLVEIDRLAREQGLSYGQYVAKYGGKI